MSALLNLVGMKNEINGSLLTIMLAVERVKMTQTDRHRQDWSEGGQMH